MKELIFVTRNTPSAISQYLCLDAELEAWLQRTKQQKLLTLLQESLPTGIQATFVEQQEGMGLGSAVLSAQEAVDEEPFAVLLCDDLILTKETQTGVLAQMCAAWEDSAQSIIAVEPVAKENTRFYGVIRCASDNDKKNTTEILDIVEKPQPEEAPSNLAVVGRYLLNPSIFSYLQKLNSLATAANTGSSTTANTTVNAELQLTDAIAQAIASNRFSSFRFSGKRFDCGTKSGYVQAILAVASQRPDIDLTL